MPLTCNIDSRGKFARLIYGLALLIGGALMIWLWAIGSGSLVRWAISLACLVGGGFAIFEACAGWCVVRAMGIKTPM